MTGSKAVNVALACGCLWLVACSRDKHQPEAVATAAAALNTNPKLSDFALYASNSLALGENAVVTGGDVGVTTAGSGPFLVNGFELAVGEKAQISAGRSLIADSVLLGEGAKVGDIQTNHLTDKKATHGQVGPFITLPALPTAAPATPGGADLSIPEKANVTVPAGAAFRNVTVGASAVVRLGGGRYQLAQLTVGEKARLEVTAATELHVARGVSLAASTYLGPASGTPLSARDVRLEASGINGTLGGLNEAPFAATVGEKSQLRALVLVPNGRLTLGEKVVVQGALFGRDVEVKSKAQITFQDGFSSPTCGSCDDGNPCTNDTCSGGVCAHTFALTGTACPDTNPCNGLEACDASGACRPGTPPALDDGNPCTSDVCTPATGVTHSPVSPGTPCGDGNACNGTETCNAAGACVAGTAVVCAARDACHLAGSCDPATGICSDPTKSDGSPCDDSDACTRSDKCKAGACVGGSRTQCGAPDQCHEAGTCDPQTGACSNPAKSDQSPCDDGSACTASDSCLAGVCTGVAVSCAALDQCHVPGTCNPATGACTNPAKANGDACDDGNPCTTSDKCVGGVCSAGAGVVCTAADPCHAPGSCDPATGLCSNPPLADLTSCSDGDACTAGDTCHGGACQPGPPVSTDDGNPCTTDSCDRASGPKHQPLAAGAACPEGFCLGTPLVCTPLAVHIDSPASLLTVGSFPVEVKGSVNTTNAIVTVNGVAVQNVGGKFSAAVALQEGHNTIVARAVDGPHESTDSVSISLDLTPPYVTIQSPADRQVLYTDKVTVTGLINDIVRGTIEATQAHVTVNGVEASISNRSYAARDVPLVAGDNVLTVLGTDQVGNVGHAELHVQRVVPVGRRLQVVSGQDQVAAIGETLPSALEVRVVDDALNPVADAKVAFRVNEGSGLVGAGTADQARAVLVTTDAQGLARTRFKLGLRSGSANHKVRAKVVGYDDEALFYASAVSKPGDKISVNSGNNQRGSVGQPLPEPLVVVVTDQGANVVQGASVRFEVTVGGGSLTGGATTYETQTDTDGRATAEYTPGALGGLDAQRVTATLLGATGSEIINAGFTATAFVPGDPGLTSISGVVLDNQDVPLPGVTLRALGTTRQAVSNAQGQFRITEAPVGPVHLLADGSTTTAPGEYPSLSYNLVTVAGVDNPLAAPIYMVKLDTATSVLAGPTDVALELPSYPGFKLEIAKGSVTFPDGAKQGRISVTPVNASAVPMAPPNGMQPQFIVTIQPTGTRFDPPARLTLPNVDGLPPGTQTDMYSYDHDLEEFVSIGLGTVSEDGTVLASNSGVGVIKAGWHCGSQPNGQGCAQQCGTCETSNQQCNCVPDVADPSCVPATLKEVAFSGTGFNAVERDNGAGPYIAPHWQDNSNPPDGDADDPGDADYPVSFVRNTRMQVAAKFNLMPLPPGISVRVRADGSDGLNVPSSSLSASGVLNPTDVTVPFKPEIDFFDPFVLAWTVSVDGGATWRPIGTSRTRVYVTLEQPQAAVFYTSVHIGSKNAEGVSSAQQAADQIFAEFQDLDVRRVTDQHQLSYWLGTTATCAFIPGTTPFPGTATWVLLQYGDDTCGAWASFFRDILRVQGISGATVTEIRPDSRPGLFDPYLLVKAYDFGPRPPIALGSLPAQGNPSPKQKFSNHAVVRYGGKIYDPSYGTVFANPGAWEDASLDGFRYADIATGSDVYFPQKVGIEETLWIDQP